MGKFDGKKLLILGTSVGSIEIIQYAQSEGAYVIVTDYLPPEQSEAKLYADETAMISTLDVDALCQFAEERRVDGIFCGVSETNLLSVQEVASRLGLPCYFTKEQWAFVENKARFKALCIEYGVPVAKQYPMEDLSSAEELEKLEYPVIVKPVDRSASIGVHVCANLEEFIAGYKDAYEKSFAHHDIVEEYIEGTQFSASYSVIHGECRLSTLTDGYQNHSQQGVPPVLDASVLPSRYLDDYLRNINENAIRMINSLHINTGIVFLQGKISDNRAAVFEAGLRISASELYKVVSRINGINMMHLLVDYALLGKADGDISLEDPYLSGKSVCLLYLLGREGKIGRMDGIQTVKDMPEVIATNLHYKEGQTISGIGTQKQRIMRAYVMGDSLSQLKQSIIRIQDAVSVEDENGNSLLLPRFDVHRLDEKHGNQ